MSEARNHEVEGSTNPKQEADLEKIGREIHKARNGVFRVQRDWEELTAIELRAYRAMACAAWAALDAIRRSPQGDPYGTAHEGAAPGDSLSGHLTASSSREAPPSPQGEDHETEVSA